MQTVCYLCGGKPVSPQPVNVLNSLGKQKVPALLIPVKRVRLRAVDQMVTLG